jgi:hypothetical protein
MRRRILTATLVTLALATMMHLDWHSARPAEHHLSLGWTYHWLLAVPSFALTACYVLRVWPEAVTRASLWIILIASVLAAIVEPAWEYWESGDREWAFGARRQSAFFAFLTMGLVTYIGVVMTVRRQATSAHG